MRLEPLPDLLESEPTSADRGPQHVRELPLGHLGSRRRLLSGAAAPADGPIRHRAASRLPVAGARRTPPGAGGQPARHGWEAVDLT
ncbi:hypothetical protein ACQPXM_08190 [Kribbella sp. CA-253562]|uniref:hypothetical protein n=1 Tax=Kribbella sp. CA-253562 TaxID=3239942 RepID=UPI003D8AB1B4